MRGRARARRVAAREAERERLMGQIKRGVLEIDEEMALFRQDFAALLQSGTEIDSRLKSWELFFKGLKD